MKQQAMVIGAGIVGLSTARALSLQGYAVTVIDRTQQAVGASVRNFGMLWPVGQPDGILYDRAMRSKAIWKDMADSTGLTYEESGSLHIAYHRDEWTVLEELYDAFRVSGRPVELLGKHAITERFRGIQKNGLMGGLFSATETIVDPRAALAMIPVYLEEYLDVKFIWGRSVQAVESNQVDLGNEVLHTDMICICNGADFESLYPQQFQQAEITKCKLQMLRFAPPSADWRIGTSICGGLSLIHYSGFKVAESLPLLRERYEKEMETYVKAGIHVMVSQNGQGELTVGDSHEYGSVFDPFNDASLNRLIMDYLKQFAVCDDWQLLQTWYGVYAKMKNGATELFLNPEPGVYIINGLGGAGMTLSFGMAEEIIQKI